MSELESAVAASDDGDDVELLAVDGGDGDPPAADGGGSQPSCATSDPNCDGIDADCDGRLDEDFQPRCLFGSISLICVEGRPVLQTCDDGSACTRDSCSAGVCRYVSTCLDDGNPCTAETCDPEVGCRSIPMPGLACDDGDICTSGDTCNAAGSCAPGVPADFDDGNVCTADSCDPVLGVAHTPQPGAACDDDNLCTEDDVCNAAAECSGVPLAVMNDGNPCTDDTCDPATGQTSHPPSAPGTSCSDGDDCNGLETCQGLTELSFTVGSKQTFYRYDSMEVTTLAPHIIRLSEVGLGPGRQIQLRTQGRNTSPDDDFSFAVFSANDQLLPRATQERVPGALQSNAPAFVSPTSFWEALPTDIPQDFRLTGTNVTVEIPADARYLFLGYFDRYYADNHGSLSVVIRALHEECVQGEPEPELCGPEG